VVGPGHPPAATATEIFPHYVADSWREKKHDDRTLFASPREAGRESFKS
jgi:hypothetical protein